MFLRPFIVVAPASLPATLYSRSVHDQEPRLVAPPSRQKGQDWLGCLRLLNFYQLYFYQLYFYQLYFYQLYFYQLYWYKLGGKNFFFVVQEHHKGTSQARRQFYVQEQHQE